MTAALDALARLDDGETREGDREIAEVFDRHLQWAQPAPYPCFICSRPCWGAECITCHNDAERDYVRRTDV